MLGKVSRHQFILVPKSLTKTWVTVLLSLRTWAVWRRSRGIGIALCVTWFFAWMLAFVVVGIFLTTLRCKQSGIHPIPSTVNSGKTFLDDPSPLTPFLGCYVTHADPILFACWAVLLFYNSCASIQNQLTFAPKF